jgi:hypothetical protein
MDANLPDAPSNVDDQSLSREFAVLKEAVSQAVSTTFRVSLSLKHLGTADQWRAFDAEWLALLETAGLCHVHTVDLFRRTRQFKEWPAERVNEFAVQLDGVIARHMRLGFSVVICATSASLGENAALHAAIWFGCH